MLQLPAPLLELAERQWQRLWARLSEAQQSLLAPHEAELRLIFGLSDFIADSAALAPDLLVEIVTSGWLQQASRQQEYGSRLAEMLAPMQSEEELKTALRRFRRQQMMVIAWRELLGRAEVEESFVHLTTLADELISQTLAWLYAKACREQGVPTSMDG